MGEAMSEERRQEIRRWVDACDYVDVMRDEQNVIDVLAEADRLVGENERLRDELIRARLRLPAACPSCGGRGSSMPMSSMACEDPWHDDRGGAALVEDVPEAPRPISAEEAERLADEIHAAEALLRAVCLNRSATAEDKQRGEPT